MAKLLNFYQPTIAGNFGKDHGWTLTKRVHIRGSRFVVEDQYELILSLAYPKEF